MSFKTFTQSDWLEFFGIICSLFVGIVSLVIALKTLRQNSKMIEESTRPYVVIYQKVTYVQDTNFYIVIKNMGQTGAVIKNVSCDINDLNNYVYLKPVNPFDFIENTFIAPNQSFLITLDPHKLSINKIDLINFEVIYSSKQKTYKENYQINFAFETYIVHSKSSTKNEELSNISFCMQEMIKQQI